MVLLAVCGTEGARHLQTENWASRTGAGGEEFLLRPHRDFIQCARACCRSERAEGIQEIRQVGERELDLIAAAKRSGDLVQQAIAAGNYYCPGIDRHIRAYRSRISQ